MSKKMIEKEATENKFQVREFQKNQSDAKLLADCFNSWDDPSSWPGGFSHQEPFTAERILEELSNEAPLSKFVAIADGKIVGHCDVVEHFKSVDTVYVGLLGVSPQYQNRKIGKNLLLLASNKAVELGKDIITLHTWEGNLKAVPLYKKIGYNWVPSSSVYMESFIPGILQKKFFKNFFENCDWYTTLRRELTLSPDEVYIEKMGVYTYFFQADDQNSLKIIIDRFAKKISGFELLSSEGKISAKCLLYDSIGFVSFKEIPIKWVFENTTQNEMSVELKVTLRDGISLTKTPETQFVIRSGEIKQIQSAVNISKEVVPIENPTNMHERTDLTIDSSILINGNEVDLSVGIMPIDPLVIQLSPSYQSILPGEKNIYQIKVWNRTKDKIKGFLSLKKIEEAIFDKYKIPINLEVNQSLEIPIEITAKEQNDTNIIQIIITPSIEEKEAIIQLPDEVLFLPIIDAFSEKSNVVGYIYENNKGIIENENLRLEISLKNSFSLEYLTDKRTNKRIRIEAACLDLGLPFIGRSNELTRIKHEVELQQDNNNASFILTVKSQEKLGIKIQRMISLSSKSDIIKITAKIINDSDQLKKNIGLRLFNDAWQTFAPNGTLYIPKKDYILKIDDFLNFGSSYHFPTLKNEWGENWLAVEIDNNSILGLLWEFSHINKVEVHPLRISNFEFLFGDLNPGESKEVNVHYYLGKGVWEDIRRIWKHLYLKNSYQKPLQLKRILKTKEQITISTESTVFGFVDEFGIQPLNNTDTLKISIKNNTKRKLTGKLEISLPKGISLEDGNQTIMQEFVDFAESNPLDLSLNIIAQESSVGRLYPFLFVFHIVGTVIEKSHFIHILDKESKVDFKKENTEEGKELISVSNGRIVFDSSKDHFGSIVSLKIPSLLEENNLNSSWPTLRPFQWEAKFIGGIYPFLGDLYGWGVRTYLEQFNSEIITKGAQKGVKYWSNLQSYDYYKGLKMEIEYTTLPMSNIIKTTFRIINNTDAHQTVNAGISSVISVANKKTNDFYFKYHGKLIKRTYQNEFWLDVEKDKWVVFIDSESKIGLAVLGPEKERYKMYLSDDGELSNHVGVTNILTIPPKDKIEFSMLYILFPLHHDLLQYLEKYY